MPLARLAIPLLAAIVLTACGGPETVSYAAQPDDHYALYLKLTIDGNDVEGIFRNADNSDDCVDTIEGEVTGKADGDELTLVLRAPSDVNIPIEGTRTGDGLKVTEDGETTVLPEGDQADYEEIVDELKAACA